MQKFYGDMSWKYIVDKRNQSEPGQPGEPANHDQKHDGDNELPRTATPIYNFLISGLILMIGDMLIFIQ